MNLPTVEFGIALLCDANGAILQIVRDDFNLGEALAPGRLFPVVVDRGSFSKAQDFLLALRAQGAVFNWELNLAIAGEVKTLYFAGGRVSDQFLVVGAKTNGDLLDLYETLLQIHNEQINQWRAMLKECITHEQPGAETGKMPVREEALYDELTRLNNELITAQRELAKKNVELERLNTLKNRFLGMAAHDLRNPLHAIVTYSDFLMTEAALDDEQREFLAAIRTSSYFMLGLVNDLLDVSVIESGKLQLNLTPVDLVALVQHNVTLNRVLAVQKQIALTFRCDGVLPTLLLDRVKIEQVLDNLISNAIKYSYPHSAVAVQLSHQPPYVLLTVQDGGQGIPEAEQANLFQFYTRTSVKSTAGEKSTGMGLAITRNIVQKHGGQIWVESQAGQGATFYVRLPTTLDYEAS